MFKDNTNAKKRIETACETVLIQFKDSLKYLKLTDARYQTDYQEELKTLLRKLNQNVDDQPTLA